jgi:hypothetical protein
MVFHDATLERTTNASGPMAARDCTEHRASLDAGYPLRERRRLPVPRHGLGSPRLADVLDSTLDMPVDRRGEGDRAEVCADLKVIRRARRSCARVHRGFSDAVLGRFGHAGA